MPLLPFGAIPPKTNVAGTGVTVTNTGSTSTIALSATGPSQYMGSIQIFNANTNWANNSTSFSNFSAISSMSTSIVGTSITAPSTNIPGFTMSGNAGLYQITYNGYVQLAGSALGNEGGLRFSDGTNVSLGVGQLSGNGTASNSPDGSFVFNIFEPVAFTNSTFQLQSISGTSSVNVQPQATAALNGILTATFDVVFLPLATYIGGITAAARYFGSTTAVTGSLAKVVWSTQDYDTNSAMSSGVYTAPFAGNLSINAALALSGTFVLNSTIDLQIQVNGVAKSETQIFAGGAMTNLVAEISDILNVNSGDLIQVQVSSSGTLPVIVSSNTKNFISLRLQ
jgi:hypothetical protein